MSRGRAAWIDPLRARARATPDHPALESPDARLSYRELDRAADRLAARVLPFLPAASAVPGRPAAVAAFLPPIPAAVAAIHGVPRTGAALAPLHPGWTLGELGDALARLDPAVVLVTDATAAAATAAIAARSLAPTVLALCPVAVTDPSARRARHGTAGTTRPSALHSVLATSGSSGRPRLVALRADNHLASARAVIERLGLGPGDRWLASLSFAHVGGLAIPIRAAVAGSTLVLRGRFAADAWATDLEGARITHLSLVPTMLRRLLEARGDRGAPSSLACALLGGAATAPSLLRRALIAGWPVAPTYGLTEASSQVATAEPERARRKPGTVGPPLRGFRLRFVDGEIQVAGPTVATGYWDAAPDRIEAGWLRTGDLGRLDEDGDLWVVGRRSERIVSGGVNVDPVEVEAVLASHREVREAAVIGLPDPEWGERVVAVVETTEGTGSARLASDLARLCRERLSAPKRPRSVRFREQLPRLPTGKPDRSALRRWLEAGEDG